MDRLSGQPVKRILETQRHDFIVNVDTLNSYMDYDTTGSLKMLTVMALTVKSKKTEKLPGTPQYNQCGGPSSAV